MQLAEINHPHRASRLHICLAKWQIEVGDLQNDHRVPKRVEAVTQVDSLLVSP